MIPAIRQRNYLQSGLYVVIVGVLAAVLLERLLTYAEVAEKAAMDATLSQLHTGLYTRVAYLALRGDYEALEALQDQSPFAAADLRSSNYLGEVGDIPVDDAAAGKWLYDRPSRELIYVPNLKRYFHPDPKNEAVRGLRFSVEVQKASKNGYKGVSIRQVGGTHWEPLQ